MTFFSPPCRPSIFRITQALAMSRQVISVSDFGQPALLGPVGDRIWPAQLSMAAIAGPRMPSAFLATDQAHRAPEPTTPLFTRTRAFGVDPPRAHPFPLRGANCGRARCDHGVTSARALETVNVHKRSARPWHLRCIKPLSMASRYRTRRFGRAGLRGLRLSRFRSVFRIYL